MSNWVLTIIADNPIIYFKSHEFIVISYEEDEVIRALMNQRAEDLLKPMP
jgi:hypothetical protein